MQITQEKVHWKLQMANSSLETMFLNC